MKIDRLIGILSLLLQKEQVTAPELAERFEVSRRTISRDISDLCLAGIPIATVRGAGGGIRIMDGYRVDRTLLSRSEMRSIIAGLRSLDSVSGNGQYARLMEKLSAGSSGVLSEDDHIQIDLSAWDRAAVSETIGSIHRAIEAKRTLRFHYVAPGGESDREIEPYCLLFRWSSWYVWGWCAARQDFRLFRLNRMTRLEWGDPFPCRPAPLPDLTPEKVFPHRYPVKAVVQPEYRFRLLEDYGSGSFTEQPDGTLLFSFGFTSPEGIRSWVLSFGDGIELLEPKELREDLRAFGERLRKKYGGT